MLKYKDRISPAAIRRRNRARFAAPGAPAQPSPPNVVALSTTTIRISLPSDPASSLPITNRRILYTINGGGSWTTLTDLTAGYSTDITVSASTTLTAYWEAQNSVGWSVSSSQASDTSFSNSALSLGFLPGLDSGTTGNIFVSPSGNDANPGTLAQPKQTIAGGKAALSPGQKLKLRAGTYREQFNLSGIGGSAGAPTEISRYGTEEVIISASNLMTGWSNAVAGDATYVGSIWPNLKKKEGIAIATFLNSNPETAFLAEAGVIMPLAMARIPYPQYPNFYRTNSDWLEGETQPAGLAYQAAITGTRLPALTDTMTQAQIEACDVLFHGENNFNYRSAISSFDPVTKIIHYTNTTQTYENSEKKDTFALLNCLPKMKKGEWGYVLTGGGTTVTLFIWPNNAATVETAIEYSARGKCVSGTTGQNYVTFKGLIFEGTSSAGANTDGNYALDFGSTGNGGNNNIRFENVKVRRTYRANRDYAPFWLRDCDDIFMQNIELENIIGSYGIFFHGQSPMAGQRNTLIDFAIYHCEDSGVRCYGQSEGIVAFGLFYETAMTAHGNKINAYEGCHRMLWWGLNLRGSSGYMTWQEASAMYIACCDMNVSYEGGTGAGRGLNDQNRQPTPAATNSLDGTSYAFNNRVSPYYPAISVVNGFAVGQSSCPEVPWNLANNIYHGTQNTQVTTQKSCLYTLGTTADPTDVLTNSTALYEDHQRGDMRYKAGSAIHTMTPHNVSSWITTISAIFGSRFTRWDWDMVGNISDFTTGFIGPTSDYTASTEFPGLWVDRPLMTGGTVVGDTASLSDGFRVGDPFPAVTYEWFLYDGADRTFTGDTGGTRVTQAGDDGFTVGVRANFGASFVDVMALSPVIDSYPLGDPVVIGQVDMAAPGSAANRQTELSAYTFSGKGIVVLVYTRNSGSTTITPTVTVGTAGRAQGTGTALTALTSARQSSVQISPFWIANPGSGSLTIQVQSGSSAYGMGVVALEIDGLVSVTGTSQSGQATVTSRSPSRTTVGTSSQVLFGCIHVGGASAGAIGITTGSTLLHEDGTGANTSTDARYIASFVRAPSAGAYSTTFTWTGAATAMSIGLEVLSA